MVSELDYGLFQQCDPAGLSPRPTVGREQGRQPAVPDAQGVGGKLQVSIKEEECDTVYVGPSFLLHLVLCHLGWVLPPHRPPPQTPEPEISERCGVCPNAGCGSFTGNVLSLHFIETPNMSRGALSLSFSDSAWTQWGQGVVDRALQVCWRIEGDTVCEALI